MRVVVDTNVLMSGIFFSGPPHRVLQAWRNGRFRLVLSPEIFDEYRRVSAVLAQQFSIDPTEILDLIIIHAEVIEAPPLPQGVCDDPDDDKFLACAIAIGGCVIVSGDKHLLKTNGYCGIRVLKPRQFVDEYQL